VSQVILCRVLDYDSKVIESSLAAAFQKLDVASHFQSGENILIKPNLLSCSRT